MKRNRPQRPNRPQRHPNATGAQRRSASSAAAPPGADRDEAVPPRQRRRLPAEPRPSQPRPRAATLAYVVLALVLIGGVVFAGIQLIRTRHSAHSPTAAKPTGLPTHAMTPTATPPPLACDVPASVLTKMPKRDKLAQLLM